MTKDLSTDLDLTSANTLWGFFRCPCVYESAYALVSLHRTKASAWRAMHRHQFDQWIELQQHQRTARWSDAELGYRSERDRGLKLDDSVAVKIEAVVVRP